VDVAREFSLPLLAQSVVDDDNSAAPAMVVDLQELLLAAFDAAP
jgi:hypothetical protein